MAKEYNDLFSDLGCMPGFRKKAPHKAVLLLSIIELYAKGLLNKNEIKLDHSLKQAFMNTWGKHVYTNYYEPIFYLPFWELQNDGFWHIVPNWRKENVFDSLKNGKRDLSEDSLQECVEYAELDEDLYFLLTMKYSRDELHKTLLQNYFDYTSSVADYYISKLEDEISPAFNTVSSVTPSFEESPAVTAYCAKQQEHPKNNQEDYSSLSLDVKIQLNIDFYTFLKESAYDKEAFLGIIPDVQSLYNVIVNNREQITSYSFSMKMSFASFLRDLKVSLMSYNDTSSLIDCIDQALTLSDESYSENSTLSGENPFVSHSVEETNKRLDEPSEFEDLQKDVAITSAPVDFSYTRDNTEDSNIPSKEKEVDKDSISLTEDSEQQFEFPNEFLKKITIKNYATQIFQILDDRKLVLYTSFGVLITRGNHLFRIFLTKNHLSIDMLSYLRGNTISKGKTIYKVSSDSPLYQVMKTDYLYGELSINKTDSDSYCLIYRGISYDSVGYSCNNQIVVPQEDNFERNDLNSKKNQTIIDNYISSCSLQNSSNHIRIINSKNVVVYNSTGYGLKINDKFYRVNRTYSALSINRINLLPDRTFETGDRILNAAGKSYFYLATLHNNTYEGVEIVEKRSGPAVVSYKGNAYNSKGELLKIKNPDGLNEDKQAEPIEPDIKDAKKISVFEPKGNLSSIPSTINDSFDYLFMLSLIECIHDYSPKKSLSLAEIGSMMIALAWDMQMKHPDEMIHETGLIKCVNYALQVIRAKKPNIFIQNKEGLFTELLLIAVDPKISNAIEILTANSQYNILKTWLPKLDYQEIYIRSLHFSKSCLYAIYPRDKDPYIVINPSWNSYLKKEYQNLQGYFMSKYLEFLDKSKK